MDYEYYNDSMNTSDFPSMKTQSHHSDYQISVRTDIGSTRDENQDRMSSAATSLGQLYIVADGMGGHKGGALAAQLTVDGIVEQLSEYPSDASIEDALRQAFDKTNHAIYEQAHSGDSETEGMGSTAVLALISWNEVHIAHVGDSRAYLFQQGALNCLTTDHTRVQKMLDAGILTPEEARDHTDASVLDRAIGTRPTVEVDIEKKFVLEKGDALLLCSDGLTGYVDDEEIEKVLRSEKSFQKTADRLVDLALQWGSKDNITVQLIQNGARTEMEKETKPRLTINRVTIVLIAVLIALLYFALRPTQDDKMNELLEQQTQVAGELNQLDQRRTTLEQQLSELQKNLTQVEAGLRKLDDETKQLKQQQKNIKQSIEKLKE